MRRRSLLLLLGLAALLALFLAGCPRGGTGRIEVPPDRYHQMVSAFYAGTGALLVDKKDTATERLGEATRLVPDEPAAWANLALLKLRGSDLEGAAKALEKAQALAPPNSRI